MRKAFFGLLTGAGLIALAVSGCSSGGGDAASFNLPDYPVQNTKVYNFSIPNFQKTDHASLVFTAMGRSDEDTSVHNFLSEPGDGIGLNGVVPSETTSKALSAKNPALAKVLSADTAVCGFHADLALANDEPSVEPTSTPTAQPAPSVHLPDMQAGDRTSLISPTPQDTIIPSPTISVEKMLDNSQTQHCSIFAEVVKSDSSSVATSLITPEDALTLAQIFDSANPFDPGEPGNIGIYDRITGIYGSEWNSNPEGGRDHDKRVNIVLCSTETMAYKNSIVLSRVRYQDAFSQSVYPTSNCGEFIYLDYESLSALSSGVSDNISLLGAISHEMLHLIEINSKLSLNGTFANMNLDKVVNPDDQVAALLDAPMLSEGFAEAAATACGFGVCGAQSLQGADFLSLDAIATSLGEDSIFYEDSAVDGFPTNALAQSTNLRKVPRGLGHLLALNIREQYGQEKLAQLTKSEGRGSENLEKVLGTPAGQTLHYLGLALGASHLDNAPLKYQFPGVKLGGPNLVRLGGEPLAFTLPLPNMNRIDVDVDKINTDTRQAPWVGTYSETGFTQGKLLPWTSAILNYAMPVDYAVDSTKFELKVTLPKDTRVNLIYESPKGTFKELY